MPCSRDSVSCVPYPLDSGVGFGATEGGGGVVVPHEVASERETERESEREGVRERERECVAVLISMEWPRFFLGSNRSDHTK